MPPFDARSLLSASWLAHGSCHSPTAVNCSPKGQTASPPSTTVTSSTVTTVDHSSIAVDMSSSEHCLLVLSNPGEPSNSDESPNPEESQAVVHGSTSEAGVLSGVILCPTFSNVELSTSGLCPAEQEEQFPASTVTSTGREKKHFGSSLHLLVTSDLSVFPAEDSSRGRPWFVVPSVVPSWRRNNNLKAFPEIWPRIFIASAILDSSRDIVTLTKRSSAKISTTNINNDPDEMKLVLNISLIFHLIWINI